MFYPTTYNGGTTQTTSGNWENGMYFTPLVSGYVSGVIFYKYANNTGSHTGNLWNSSGTLLSSVIFSDETASGYQQAFFTTAVAVTANSDYVISCNIANGATYWTSFQSYPLNPSPQSTLIKVNSSGQSFTAGTFPNAGGVTNGYLGVDILFTTTSPWALFLPAGQVGPSGPTGPIGPLGPDGTNYSDYIYWNTGTTSWAVGSTDVHIGGNAGMTNQGPNSVAIGYQSGQFTQGNNSVAIGYQSGRYNNPEYSVAIGYQAGQTGASAGATGTISIGAFSGALSQAHNSVAIGTRAGQNTQGNHSVSIGYQTGQFSQGSHSVAIGYQSGQYNIPNGAIFIGNSAGSTGSTGATGSICIGTNSGDRYQSSGSVSIGPGSSMNGQGPATVSIGYNAGASGTTGAIDNTLVGYNAGSNLGPGQYNVMIGSQAGPSNGSGCTGNVFIGYYSGTGITSGSDNVFIGTLASANTISYTGTTGTTSNSLTIGSDTTRLTTISIGPYGIMRFPRRTGFLSGGVQRVLIMLLPTSGTIGSCAIMVSSTATSSTPNTGITSGIVTLSAFNRNGAISAVISTATATSTITSAGTLTNTYAATTALGGGATGAAMNLTVTGNAAFGTTFTSSSAQFMVYNIAPSDIRILAI